ncbi:LCP family protein [Streptomyces sp. H10-C2]|uniref:LCP family protein n=1 Tax=unclassified Streptomyces TaxID=2593676 RepID=UPI0024B99DDA|nr:MULTISPECIES: LCP family protein [unclassified Streptomyces]MDJ0341266.1 LCP family protein [Streptomyces sp. PH10-H1]MDJ0370861.1 LCP family protein [Streptomyces sp. H10-C2]
MDTQGRRNIDPADQWVLDPETGSYVPRLQTEEPPSPSVSVQGGRRERREQQGAGAAPSSRRKAKPRTSRKKKVLIWTAGTVGFVLVAGSIGGYFVYQHFNNNITTVDVGDAGSKNVTTDGPVNILVIGTDSRVGLGNEYGDAGSVGHADTTILFHVSKDRSNATALSIPRDLMTNIPDCPTKQKDGSTKVVPAEQNVRFNTSLGQEGRDPGCTMRAVKQLTGVSVDHFMMANFNAVKDLSTAVGGVDICLAKPINDPKSHLNLGKGHHNVAGDEALAFVRTRHAVGFGGDLDRIKLQQQFLGSMIRQMKSGDTLTSPNKLWKLANAATKALTVDSAIGSISKLSDLAKDLSSVDTKNITFATVPVIDNPADGKVHKTVVLDPTKASQVFSMVRSDISLTAVTKKKTGTPGSPAAPDKLAGTKAPASQVRVKVFNGSGVTGVAQDTISWLQNSKAVNRSTNGGNAPAGVVATTTLVYAPNQADQARALAAMMGLPATALQPGTADAAPKANMTLTLGRDFKGAGTPIAAPTTAPEGIQKVVADDKSVCAK